MPPDGTSPGGELPFHQFHVPRCDSNLGQALEYMCIMERHRALVQTVAPQIKSHMTVVKIDTEKYENLAARYQIQELPTMIVFKQGEVVQRIKGYRDPEELMQVLSPYITARA